MNHKDKKIIVANWKMNPSTVAEARRIFAAAKRAAAKIRRATVVICPPFLYLPALAKAAKNTRNIALGVQDIFWEIAGSYTSQISPVMILNADAQYAIVGHSERRVLGETDSQVAKKAILALKLGLRAIVCVGENLRDEKGEYLGFLKNQIRNSLQGVTGKLLENLIIAYEPVWAIGGREAMKPEQVEEMGIFIRKILADIYEQEAAFKVPILYGGSVDAKNAEAIVYQGNVQGLLIGRQSLEPESFKAILSVM
ncbi:MAG: triosephosphate isomerase [Parcubacteria group bacterium Gr01-1014_73]|nr:MAG: triosephosphate isomerase [Parcubacteria group bacterium Gr01-1014_73]